MQVIDWKEYLSTLLTPVQLHELGQELLDTAQQTQAMPFSPAQLAELERRWADVESGRVQPQPWNDEVLAELLNGR